MVQKTVLHLEDDPCLADLVKLTFESFGFSGEFLQATRVEEAVNLLKERRLKKSPVDLILSDMHLPDGRGLDLLQSIKSSPTWSKTPVIILSSDKSPELVSEAYALGANCYLSKLPRKGHGLDQFRSLYQLWIENTLIPEPSFADGVQEIFSKAISLRARTAQFYITLSELAENTPVEESFWLERAMVEGNLSSLLLFLQSVISEEIIPTELTERLSMMQTKVEEALISAEQSFRKENYTEKLDINRAVLSLLESWDEEIFVDLFSTLFPLNTKVSYALKLRGCGQLREIADYVIAKTTETETILRANLLKEVSARLEGMTAGSPDDN